MNYLAHIFLSGNDRCIQIGNFIGDGVKGDGYKQYRRKFPGQPVSGLCRSSPQTVQPEVLYRLSLELPPPAGTFSGVHMAFHPD